MEKLKNKIKNLPLKKYFVLIVLTTFTIVIICSLLSIFCFIKFRQYLLPDSNVVHITFNVVDTDGNEEVLSTNSKFGDKMSSLNFLSEIDKEKRYFELSNLKVSAYKIENSFENLTPKRKFAYQASGVLMIVFPMIFSISGVLVSGFLFYRKKLCRPLEILTNSMNEISSKNLDFKIDYNCNDELGRLCNSFENMRKILEENNKELWKMIEERKIVQASVAHDLRNPISIIEGYTEYLQDNIENDKLSKKRILDIINNMSKTAKRLETYTNSIREINQLDDIEIQCKNVSSIDFINDIKEDLSLMAKAKGIKLLVEEKKLDGNINIDTQIIYRIMENIINNSLRYAKNEIKLSIEIADKNILKEKDKFILPNINHEEHLGLGLTISKILCQKHGGKLEISNNIEGGANVKIFIKV